MVLPAYLTLLFGIMEFGHAQLVGNLLSSACRAGARVGSTEGTTTADVIAKVRQTLGSAVNPNTVTIFVNDASVYDSGGSVPTTAAGVEALPSLEVADAEPRQMFVVRARVSYNSVAPLPLSFFNGVVLGAESFMRHE
jgi:Flp pilus assembly protein TadG